MRELRNKLSDRLAGYIHDLMEGSTHMVDDMYILLHEAGYADEDGFPIYEGEDGDEE